MHLERKEIHHHYLEYSQQVGWASMIYPVGLFFVSEVYKNSSLFLFVSLIQLISICFQSYLCINYHNFSHKLDLWDKCFFISRSLISLCIGINMTGAFNYDPGLGFSAVLTAAAYAASVEAYAASFHPNLTLFFSSLALTGVPPLIQSYIRLYDASTSHTIATVGVIYLVSIGFKGLSLNRGFKRSVQLNLEKLESQARVSKILDAMPAKVTWIDENLRYLEVNNTMVQSYGLSKTDYIGQKVGFQDPQDSSPLSKVLEDFKKSDKESIAIEAALRFKSQKEVVHSIQIKKILGTNNEGQPTLEFIIVAVDMTEHKKIQEQLEDEKLRNLHSARLSSIGEMAAGIAHEIKNPLAILQSILEVLQKEIIVVPLDQSRVQMRINKIIENIKRISNIVNSMQKLSRDTSSLEMNWSSCDAILADPLALSLQRFRKAEIDLNIYYSHGDNFEIFCQPQQIGQVIINLLNNAHDALLSQADRKIKLSFDYTDTGTLMLSVSDNGPGVKDPEKLFTPFYTTKAPGVGTGLGLSISKKMIEQNKSTLSYTRSDDYSNFIIEFPAASVRPITKIRKTAT